MQFRNECWNTLWWFNYIIFTPFSPVESLPDSHLTGHYSVFHLFVLILPLILKEKQNNTEDCARGNTISWQQNTCQINTAETLKYYIHPTEVLWFILLLTGKILKHMVKDRTIYQPQVHGSGMPKNFTFFYVIKQVMCPKMPALSSRYIQKKSHHKYQEIPLVLIYEKFSLASNKDHINHKAGRWDSYTQPLFRCLNQGKLFQPSGLFGVHR